MMGYLQAFLATKSLSPNSKAAYFYDLQQFLNKCEGAPPTPSKLARYQAFLQGLKPAAQRRKQSAVNQFLYYLYENGIIDRYYKVKLPQHVLPQRVVSPLEEMDFLWAESQYPDGQRIALFIASLGLLPSELARIRLEDIDFNFQVLTIEKAGQKRILSIPKELLTCVESTKGVYLFDKKGTPYSRQWFFNRLSEFLEEQGKSEWTAQKLREQFILGQLQAGKDVSEIAKQLGLKTAISLEKYKDGY